MANVVDVDVITENIFLRRLAGDLEDTFHLIAYAGKSTDIEFIERRQREICREYGGEFSECYSDPATFHIVHAYDALQRMLKPDQDPKRIQSEAEEAIFEHLNIPVADDI